MDREKIIEALNDYFQINKDCYAYNLTRVKEGFAVVRLLWTILKSLTSKSRQTSPTT